MAYRHSYHKGIHRKLMIVHDGCFDDLSAINDTCTLCSYWVPHVETLKLIVYSSGQSVLWDQRAIAYPCSSITKNSCYTLVRT